MDNEKESPVFKVPKLFGPRPGTKKPVICEDIISNDTDVASTTNMEVNTKPIVEQTIDQPKKISKTTSQVPIPYEEPSWGGKPGDKYFLEVCIDSLFIKILFMAYIVII